jgi:hypothetical protein
MKPLFKVLLPGFLMVIAVFGYTKILRQQFSAPAHQSVETLDQTVHPRGATITASATNPERVTGPGSILILEPRAAVTLIDCLEAPCTYRHDTGKVTINGQAILTVRTHQVTISGEAVLTHYSWLDEWNIKVNRGLTLIDGTPHEAGADVTINTK